MPSGYTYKGLVGAVYNDSGSDFGDFHQVGNRVAALETVDLSVGTATSYTSVALSIPPIATFIHGSVNQDDTDTMATGYIAATSSGLGQMFLRSRFTSAENVIISHHFSLPIIEASTCYYLVSSGDTMTIRTTGWEF